PEPSSLPHDQACRTAPSATPASVHVSACTRHEPMAERDKRPNWSNRRGAKTTTPVHIAAPPPTEIRHPTCAEQTRSPTEHAPSRRSDSRAQSARKDHPRPSGSPSLEFSVTPRKTSITDSRSREHTTFKGLDWHPNLLEGTSHSKP